MKFEKKILLGEKSKYLKQYILQIFLSGIVVVG
jgi:hypothetical protein